VVRGKINRAKEARRWCSPKRDEGGGGGSKSGIDDGSSVPIGGQEVERGDGEVLRWGGGGGVFMRRIEMVKRGARAAAGIFFKGGGGVEQWRAGPGLRHVARRWDSPGPTGRQRAAGNNPVVVLTGGAHASDAWSALKKGPGTLIFGASAIVTSGNVEILIQIQIQIDSNSIKV
jgi:hypothetical protein